MMQGDTLKFHHIAVASENIEKEFRSYSLLGYEKEAEQFTDSIQGIIGQFIIAKNQPRLELLQNAENSHTLDSWLEKGIKLYHYAYETDDMNKAIEFLTANRAKLVSPQKKSVYFKQNICFFILPNRFLIELIGR